MAISGFGRGKDGATVSSGSNKSASGASSGGFGNLTAFIDQGSQFEGKLSFKDTVRIDGLFSGEISSENTLIIGETGHIVARVSSERVVVSGHVEGNVSASEQIVLHKTAVVNGDLESPIVIMEEGAQLNGGVKMSKPGQASAKPGAPLNPTEGGA
jgi:cytoskeletal protein CcmA (bactofilin family)